ncbi:MAG TPA: Dyp-type peroxidase [Aeromicrobium sp.]|nr:Dyp-type peroxidase [Aeromicrobium sp.]
MKRRELLGRGAAIAGGATIAGGLAVASASSAPAQAVDAPPVGAETIEFHGTHQAGIEGEPQANQTLVSFDLTGNPEPDDIHRLLSLLTDDAQRLTSGRAPLADLEPELASTPARLTVTFGFGPGLVAAVVGEKNVPSWLGPLPAFKQIDRLQENWSDGDLLLQVAGDDPISVAHAVHLLVRDTRAFAKVRWSQVGFRQGLGVHPPGTTMRNLFGQVDGTVNPEPQTPDFAEVVWRPDHSTTMVIRRIAMNLDTWEKADRTGREFAVGRRLRDGSPLTGTAENDVPDLAATDAQGFTVIGPAAHIRRAKTGDPTQRFLRRAYNYDLGPGNADAVGLIFTAFQADIAHQFVPVQQRLAQSDGLNEWTTPIGSAVFWIPAGVRPGEIVGAALFEPLG